MKSPLIALLALSLGLNAALGFYFLSRSVTHLGSSFIPGSTSPAAAATAKSAAPKTAAASTQETSTPLQWHSPRSNQDLHSLVADLRNAGFPPTVVRAIIGQMLNDRYAAQRPGADLPFWKRNQITPEIIAAQQAQNAERQALYESLLGTDARFSATIDPVSRQQRYGNLSDDKLDAVARIERDYNEVRSAAYAASSGNAATRGTSLMEQQKVLEQEKKADLAAVLSPEELAQYEMRNSTSASRLMGSLKSIDISEAEYASLYQVQKNLDETTPSPANGTFTPEMMAQRTAAQQVANEEARTVLGEERFYKYLESSDYNYARVTQFTTQYPNVTPSVSYQLYQLQTEAQAAMSRASRNRTGTSQQRALDMQALMAGYETKLQTLVGPEVATAYKKTPYGRIFSFGSRTSGEN